MSCDGLGVVGGIHCYVLYTIELFSVGSVSWSVVGAVGGAVELFFVGCVQCAVIGSVERISVGSVQCAAFGTVERVTAGAV